MVKRSSPASETGQGEGPAPAWVSPAEAAVYLGIGTTSFYKDVMGQIDVRKLGTRTLVSVRSLDRFMAGLPRQAEPGLRLIRRGSGRRFSRKSG